MVANAQATPSPDSRVRRAFADTPDGQVHYRSAGSGAPFVLMHWAPSSGRQNVRVIQLLAGQGYQAIALDLMGYGDSDKPDRQWSIEDYAANLGAVLDALELEQVFLYGGHTSAAIAAEFAATRPARVRALVLDGSPLYDVDERRKLAGSYVPPMRLAADGSHMVWAWKRAYRRPEMPLEEVFAASVDLLKAGFTYHIGYEAVFAFDMARRLPLLRMPVMAMTSPDDPLFCAHEKVKALVPDCYEFIGAPRTSQSSEQRAQASVAAMTGFLRETAT